MSSRHGPRRGNLAKSRGGLWKQSKSHLRVVPTHAEAGIFTHLPGGDQLKRLSLGMSFPRHLWLSVYSAKGPQQPEDNPPTESHRCWLSGADHTAFIHSIRGGRWCVAPAVLSFSASPWKLVNASRRLAGEGVCIEEKGTHSCKR